MPTPVRWRGRPVRCRGRPRAARGRARRLRIIHASPGLEIGVYVLVAPEPDQQQPHEDDAGYVVLDGRGVLKVEGNPVALERGQAVYVPAGARHGFTAYEQLSVLVIFARRWRVDAAAGDAAAPSNAGTGRDAPASR